MPILISCPHCDWKGRVKEHLAGKKGKCPTCGELIPIPAATRGTPPPLAGKKSSIDDEPDVVDDAEVVEDEPPRRGKPSGRIDTERKRRRNDAEASIPSRSRRRQADEDENDRPSRSRRRRDEDEEDERPRRTRRSSRDDDEDRPTKARRRDGGRAGKRRRAKPPESANVKKVGAIVGGLLAILLGGAWLAVTFFVLDRPRFIGPGIVILLGIIGVFQGVTGAGLSSDSSEDDDE